MQRRTPILAILLAPVALYGLVLLWQFALLPLHVLTWHSDTVLRWRLGSNEPEHREKALLHAMSARSPDQALFGKIVDIMRTDAAPQVRTAAAHTLGQIGRRQSLPTAATQALIGLVLQTEDDAMLSAAMKAVGHSAAHNPYPDEVSRRIAAVLDEPRLPWVHDSAIEALGGIGAVQPMPGEVFGTMNAAFRRPDKSGIRERLAGAYTRIAEGRSLPATTLDLLADALRHDRNDRIRVQAVYALAYAAADYPQARVLIAEAAHDARREVQEAAQHGLRIMDYRQTFAGRDPAALALDRTLPVDTRLKAIGLIEIKRDDARVREQILGLAGDEDPLVAAGALGKLGDFATSPGDDFDRRFLIPRLNAAMSHPDPRVRKEAFGALGRLFQYPAYREHAGEFRTVLEAGAADPVADVRIVALATMLRAEPGVEASDAIRERALNDVDPVVRGHAVGWLASPNRVTDRRRALLDKAKQDPDAWVRQIAIETERKWASRRSEGSTARLVAMWQAGEYGKLGLTVLTYATIGAPVLVGGAFLLYYMARMLAYAMQKRWHALAVVPVMAVWLAASYGMFMLYFAFGHAGHLDTREMLQLAGILWAAIALYAALGWGMHYLIRR